MNAAEYVRRYEAGETTEFLITDSDHVETISSISIEGAAREYSLRTRKTGCHRITGDFGKSGAFQAYRLLKDAHSTVGAQFHVREA